MKIDSSILKSVIPQSDSKKEKEKVEAPATQAKETNVLKNDIRSIQTSSLEKVSFENFDTAKDGVKHISRSLKEEPQQLESVHHDMNQENILYLLRNEE